MNKSEKEILDYISKTYIKYHYENNNNEISVDEKENIDEFLILVDSVLDRFSYEDRIIIENEYLSSKMNSKWWIGIYPKSSYYRKKSRLSTEFLHCFTL